FPGFAQKRGQTPDPLRLERWFALPVGGQSPFLGKAGFPGEVAWPFSARLFRDLSQGLDEN
ncbi:MAG TPA: hypothetical protein VEI07_06410, partial [Planctomycetaceae bacterium]|nr:hypothetical protein [Planctomycetaceae bacterium]